MKFTIVTLCALFVMHSSVKSQNIRFDIVPPELPKPQIEILIDGLHNADFEFADLDNDGDKDLVLTGQTNIHYLTATYRNDGKGNFDNWNSDLPKVNLGIVALGDIDSDGDIDLLVSGGNTGTNSSQYYAAIYKNDGFGNYSVYSDSVIIPVNFGDAKFADIDNDGDVDLYVAGSAAGDGYSSNMYLNDGQGNFTLDNSSILVGSRNCTIIFHDIDNDNDVDLTIEGELKTGSRIITYLNDSTGNFTYLKTGIQNALHGEIDFGDLDNDGDLDAVYIGEGKADIYINNGNLILLK